MAPQLHFGTTQQQDQCFPHTPQALFIKLWQESWVGGTFCHNEFLLPKKFYSLSISNSRTERVMAGATSLVPQKRMPQGRLGGSVVKRLPSAQGLIPRSWNQAPHRAPCSAGSLLLPLPLPLLVFPLSLTMSLCQINKILKKKMYASPTPRVPLPQVQ